MQIFIAFLTAYWKLAVGFILVGIIWFYYNQSNTLSNKLKEINIELSQQMARLSDCGDKVTTLSASVTDLKARNDVLKYNITKSQLSVDDINAATKKIITEINKKKIPDDCAGQIDYLKARAIERNKG